MSNNLYSNYTQRRQQIINRAMEWRREKFDEIRTHYECSHTGITELRTRALPSGAITIIEQCRRCGNQIKAVPKKQYSPSQIAAMPVFDANLQNQFWGNRRQSYDSWGKHIEEWQTRHLAELEIEFQAEKEQSQTEWRDAYNQYLQSAEWQEKRRLVLKRAGGICEGCGVNRPTQAHHLTYEHLGNEFLWELRAVCRACHERVHGIKQEWQKEA